MTKTIKTKILKSITFIPGVISLANVDFTKRPISLIKEETWIKGVLFETTDMGEFIKVAVIVVSSARAKNIAKEISSSIKVILKKEHLKINRVEVYIRGVK